MPINNIKINTDDLIKSNNGKINWCASILNHSFIKYSFNGTEYILTISQKAKNNRHYVYVKYADKEFLKSKEALLKGYIRDVINHENYIGKKIHKEISLPKTNYYIYCHVNKINKKIYIGLTSMYPTDRWKSGEGYSQQVFGRAIKKYGWDNFEHIILFNSLTKEEAELIESELIKKYDTQNPLYGYNKSSGGECYEWTEEMRTRMSESQKGRRLTAEWIRNRSKAQTGLKRSQETEQKISDARSRKIICLNTGKTYKNLSEVDKLFGGGIGHISACCNGKRKSAGKDELGTPLQWMYYDDYLTKICSSQYPTLKVRENTNIKVLDKSSNIIYKSINVAVKMTGVKYDDLYKDINGVSDRFQIVKDGGVFGSISR